MPVLAKFCGIVIRMLIGPTIGMRVHAFHGDSEVVVALNPLRVIQSDAPQWVDARVLAWIREHQNELFAPWNPAMPVLEAGGLGNATHDRRLPTRSEWPNG